MPFSAINEQAILFITANVKNRRWYFVTAKRAESLGQVIQTCCELKGFKLLAYCILPNHVHMLVKRRTLESVRPEIADNPRPFLIPDRRLSSRRSKSQFSTSELLQSIKGTFSRSLPKGTFWQRRSYILHVESENYLDTLIDYIRFNYTKMNLPKRYGQAPFVCINERAIANLF